MSPGYPFGVASLGDGNFVLSDPREEALRFFDVTNFVGNIGVAADQEYAVYGGGYRNGPGGLVNTPLGIAAIDPHTIVFADAGNRRIRLVSNLETRHWARHQIEPFGDHGDATKYYRVLIVGDCYVGWGVPYASTIAGRLERDLNANRKELGIPHPVRVELIFSGHTSDVRDYMRDVVASGIADLVIWEFNDAMPNEEWTPGRGCECPAIRLRSGERKKEEAGFNPAGIVVEAGDFGLRKLGRNVRFQTYAIENLRHGHRRNRTLILLPSTNLAPGGGTCW